jgi:integration host factor subunit beta
MTKADLVEEVVRVSELSKKQAEAIVNTVFLAIVDALKHDDKIELRGFGGFRVRKRRSRRGATPKPGTAWTARQADPLLQPGKG